MQQGMDQYIDMPGIKKLDWIGLDRDCQSHFALQERGAGEYLAEYLN